MIPKEPVNFTRGTKVLVNLGQLLEVNRDVFKSGIVSGRYPTKKAENHSDFLGWIVDFDFPLNSETFVPDGGYEFDSIVVPSKFIQSVPPSDPITGSL